MKQTASEENFCFYFYFYLFFPLTERLLVGYWQIIMRVFLLSSCGFTTLLKHIDGVVLNFCWGQYMFRPLHSVPLHVRSFAFLIFNFFLFLKTSKMEKMTDYLEFKTVLNSVTDKLNKDFNPLRNVKLFDSRLYLVEKIFQKLPYVTVLERTFV